MSGGIIYNMTTKFIMLMGPPCVGKSVIAKYIKDTHTNCRIVSKTDILKAHTELSVFSSKSNKIFCNEINEALQLYDIVIADDTQTTIASRKRVFKNLNLKNVKVIGIWIEASLKSALSYNETRSNLDYLDPFVIKEIFKYSVSPQKYEPFDDIVFINKDSCIGISKTHPKIENIFKTLEQI